MCTCTSTLTNISTLEEVAAVLESLGYDVKPQEHSVAFPVGGFAAVVTIDGKTLKITCQLMTLADIPDENEASVLVTLLDLNSVVVPYAFALLTATDGGEFEMGSAPVILVDSMPIGDISEEEFESAVNSLLSALVLSQEHLEGILA